MHSLSRRQLVLAAAASVATPFATAAETWPTQPIKLLVGAGAGGSTDLTARLVAQELAKLLGQPVIVENRAGAGGTLAMRQLVRAPADGHTLVWTGNSAMTIAPYLFKDPGYDVQALIPVSLGTTSSFVLLADPRFSALKELVAYGKSHPGKLGFGSNGVNSSTHLLGELLRNEAGFEALHIPYKGGAESASALLSGSIQFTFDALSSNLSLIESGRLRALAVTGARREPSLPQVPTLAELGLPGVSMQVYFGLVAAPKTPAPVVARLNSAMRTVLEQPALREALQKTGNQPQSSTPEAFRAMVDAEGARFKALIAATGITPE